MTTLRIQIQKIADLDAVIHGLAAIWRLIKADTNTKVRCPKGVTVTDEPQRLYLDDGQCARRYPLNLATMELGVGVSVSSGEWAVHAGPNHTESIDGVPNAAAVIDCVWHDYFRYFSVTVTVAKGAIPAQMTA